jgi:hypothetical protein
MIEAQTEYDLVWASIHHLEWSEAMSESIVLPTHPRFKNLTGLSFGRWTVVAYRGRHKSRPTSWLCRCECGTERIVISSSLVAVSGTQSCGCFQKEQLASRMLTHGYSSAAEHMAWASLKDRCHNEKSSSYDGYGGRGISVCDRWRDSFENFLADMGERPSKEHSIDRKDNDGNYEPDNCRWATKKEQGRNRRSNRILTFNNKTQTLIEWSEELGISSAVIRQRIKASGWSIEEALTTPARQYKKRSSKID